MSKQESLLTRLRRRLGYALIPGTTELSVALARQSAMQTLSVACQVAETEADRESYRDVYRLLKEGISVRPEWDHSFGVLDDD